MNITREQFLIDYHSKYDVVEVRSQDLQGLLRDCEVWQKECEHLRKENEGLKFRDTIRVEQINSLNDRIRKLEEIRVRVLI